MKNIQLIGLLLLISGFLLLMLYSAVKSFQEIDIATVPILVLFGGFAIIIGGSALLISIFFEQQKDMKKRRKEIKKEDFEP